MNLKIKKLHPDAVLPKRATDASAGYDLCARLDTPVALESGNRTLIPTGIAIGLPGPETVGLIYARSGLATQYGLALSNGVGVIDSDYTGEVKVGLINLSDTAYIIKPGERIAQLVIAPILLPEIVETELEETMRGSGGFGSTGN